VCAFVAFILICSVPGESNAQVTESSRWGVSASFTPSWKMNDDLAEPLFWPGPGLEGSDFSVALVRGGRSGEWGVSFVRKAIKDEEITFTDPAECDESGFSCYQATRTDVYQDANYNGIEAHWFIPFVKPNDRLGIGVNVGGGVAFTSDAVTRTETYTFTDNIPGFPPSVFSDTTVYEQTLPDTVPLIKAEAQASIALSPDLWVRVAGGLNVPSAFAFRLSVAYFFGAR
jgi:hypothetical protein